MITYGCLAHFDHYFNDDVIFAKRYGFTFLQIWYDRNGIILKKETNPVETIKNANFPFIIHAVLDITEFEQHIIKLVKLLKDLDQREIIIHPVCKNENINSKTNLKLRDKVINANDIFRQNNIILHLENNSKLDPIFSSFEDIKEILMDIKDIQIILDIAHMESYDHIRNIVAIREPKYLHIADRHLEVIHEHLPIGNGNINFEKIFNEILLKNDYKIVLEIVDTDELIIKSKNIIDGIINGKIRSA